MEVFGSNYLINKIIRYFVGLRNVTKKSPGHFGVPRTEKAGELVWGISGQGPHWAQVDETVSGRG